MPERSNLADPERLAVLRDSGLLDPTTEAAFNRLTRLAAVLLHAPLAFVNAIDAQQQISKSSFTPATWPSDPVASLNDSFCKFPVLRHESLIIAETLTDDLVNQSSFVTELGLRSYAAFPLITGDGYALGTLCVADLVPRDWNDHELAILHDLAQSVVSEIELRRELIKRTRAEQDLLQRTETIGLLQLIAATANAATTFDEAIDGVLQHIGDYTGWRALSIYRVDHHGHLKNSFHYESNVQQSINADEAIRIDTLRNALAQKVLDEHESCWIPDLMAHINDLPVVESLRAATAFPVLVNQRCAALIIVLDEQPQPYNQRLNYVMHHIGALLSIVIEREETAALLRLRALVDPTTGIANRHGFLVLAEQHAKQAHHNHESFALFFIDLDGMKHINDTWGHACGDLALIETATILREAFRAVDIIARLGGDEFVVIANVAEPELTTSMCQRIQEQVTLHNQRSERPFKLSLSVGVACWDPTEPWSIDELLHRADSAMYAEKRRKYARNTQSVPQQP